MPWKEVSMMSERKEFVSLATLPGANRRALCRRFGISPNTAYKWPERYGVGGDAALVDRSRRPHRSPARTTSEIEAGVVALRDEFPFWGARKLRKIGLNRGLKLPAISTVHAILKRHGRVSDEAARITRPMQRFEREAPNELWQMDFKGDFALARGGRCHPLTIVDDHSRYCVCVQACADQRHDTVQARLERTFQRYGLPWEILADHGAPWGADLDSLHTRLTVWLLRLGIRVTHGRPHHPQTQGKEERFNRTLKHEVLRFHPPFDTLPRAQQAFDRFRQRYNEVRPHEALDDQPPASRYSPSRRDFPDPLPELEYPPQAQLRRVTEKSFSWRGQTWRIGKPFRGQTLGLVEADQDGCWDVYYGRLQVATINESTGSIEKTLC